MTKKPSNKGLPGVVQKVEPVISIDELMEEDVIVPQEGIYELDTVDDATAPSPEDSGVSIPTNPRKIADVGNKIYPVSNTTNDYLTILGYGNNGTGKTTFGATARTPCSSTQSLG